MFDASQKSTGTSYTTTVALLAVACVFSPAILIASRPFGYFALSTAVICSAVCLVLAFVTWKRSSQLTIPSIANRRAK